MTEENRSANAWKNPLFRESGSSGRLAETLLRGNSLRQKAAAGWALGTFLIELPTSASITAMAQAGFDFVVLDMEHSDIDFSTLGTLITAGHAAGLAVLVRVWGKDCGLIGKALDMGAHGIMAPHVNTPEQARNIVDQARYKPLGNRGFSPLMKYQCLSEPLEMLGTATYVVVQIEGKAALERAGEIAAVPGIDAIFVGPYDLALSLGVPPGSPEVHAAADRLAVAVPDNIALGIYVDDPASCGDWAARRYAVQCVSFDGRMLSDGAHRVTAMAQNGVDESLKAK